MIRRAGIFPFIFFLLSSCAHQPSRATMNSGAAITSIADEDEEQITSELFDPNSSAQQNINPNTTMPIMPHTVKEMQYASGMNP